MAVGGLDCLAEVLERRLVIPTPLRPKLRSMHPTKALFLVATILAISSLCIALPKDDNDGQKTNVKVRPTSFPLFWPSTLLDSRSLGELHHV